MPTALSRKYMRTRKMMIPMIKDPVRSLKIPMKIVIMMRIKEISMILPLL